MMECDLSKFVANICPTQGLIGVFDLVRSIAPTATSDSTQEDIWSGQYEADFCNDGSSPTNSIEDTDGALDVVCSLPAPNVDVLFGSKAFALQAFKALGCDKGMLRSDTFADPGTVLYADVFAGANFFKLDPDFFKMHPELYDPTSGLMANSTVRLRPPHSKPIVPPRPLDSSTLGRYRELSTWTFDLSFFQTGSTATAW